MCDKIIKRNIPKDEIPKYVYKVVQKVGNDKYVTPVMGEPLQKGTWKKAKKYDKSKDPSESMIYWLTTKFKKHYSASSSYWTEHHVGKWGSFKHERSAKFSNLVKNFVDSSGDRFPSIVVKCEIKGDVDSSTYMDSLTFLSTHIRVVEEICEQ